MAEFIKGTKLSLEIEGLIERAREYIWLISPYIKLHGRIKEELETRRDDYNVHLLIVFGKNEHDLSKSISAEDVNFLRGFPNVSIYYHKDLHAKFYSNEDYSIITSMNLHQFSQDKNIEAGILLQHKNVLSKLADLALSKTDAGQEAHSYFIEVIKQSQLLLHRKPDVKINWFPIPDKYLGSNNEVDIIDDFFKTHKTFIANPVYNTPISKSAVQYIKTQQIVSPPQPSTSHSSSGYCIRTGVQIPFNTTKPMSNEAFKSWEKFKNKEYPEKFCHYSGEPSNGDTSVGKPILRKNWSKAKG